MSGDNNAIVSLPGPGWHMLWPTSFGDFQLDIVGFLAVLGEGSISSVAQVSALSRLFYLPRLLPAPQALLQPSRPTALPATEASVAAIRTGNFKDHIHHVAHVLLGNQMPLHQVRCVHIKKKSRDQYISPFTKRIDSFLRGVSKQKKSNAATYEPPQVKARAIGPLFWVSSLGFILSLGLFIISLCFGDGMSLMATLLLSGLSSLIGVSNKWELGLPQPAKKPQQSADTSGKDRRDKKFLEEAEDDLEQGAKKAPVQPKEDEGITEEHGVVIRYPNGSFLVVRCNEEVARELYFAPEVINYSIESNTIYRLISLVGTLMLMLGVIFLANAKLRLQLCWAGSYVLLNAAHWVAAAVPQKLHWDLDCYDVREQSLSDGPQGANFTEALWKAICFARDTRWARIGKHAAPQTPVWDAWLEKAREAAAGIQPMKDRRLIHPIYQPKIPKSELEKAGSGKNEKYIRGIVWQVPKWDAKAEYDKLDRAYNDGLLNQTNQTNGVPVNASYG